MPAKSLFKICLLSLIAFVLCFVVGQFWGATDSAERAPGGLTVKVVPKDVLIVGVGNAAYMDLARSTTLGKIHIEGWAVFRRGNPRLFVRSNSEMKISTAYLYPRTDLSEFPSAIGFGLILEASRDLVGEVCLLTRENGDFHQIGGSKC